MRLVAVIFIVSFLVFTVPHAVDAKMPNITISSHHSPRTITATWADTTAFWEAGGSPTRLNGPPPKLGPRYEVLSWYWQRAVGSPAEEPPVDDVALYYPHCAYHMRLCELGVVQVVGGGREVWIELDETRDAILRRYITLQNALPEKPTPIELFAAAVILSGEDISVQVEGDPLDATTSRTFWEEAFAMVGQARTYEYPRRITPNERLLITIELPEGRAVTVRYVPWLLCFCPEVTGVGPGPTVRLTGLPTTPLLNGLLHDLRPPASATSPTTSELGVATQPAWWVYIVIVAEAAMSLIGAGIVARKLQLGLAAIQRRTR